MDDQINDYLLKQLPKNSLWINDLENQAEIDRVPIMDPIGMDFVMQLIRLNQPKKILEIGTAIGYSALRMAEVSKTISITTIEKDKVRYDQAVINLNKYDTEHQITPIFGDAIEEMEQMVSNNDHYDMIFIDAAKGKYRDFFNLADILLEKNGVIIADNVLFRGYVADEAFNHPRYRNMVKKLRDFNEWVSKNTHYHTTIVPIGDGVAISYKN